MKIDNAPANPQANVLSARHSPPAEAARQATPAGPSLPGPQVALLADGGIKLLLAEMARLFMEQENILELLFPAASAKEKAEPRPSPRPSPDRTAPGQVASDRQPPDRVIAKGFAAMIKGAYSSGDTLKTYAQKLDSTLALVKHFPGGLPENIAREAARISKQLSALGPAFSDEFSALTGQLAAGAPPEAAAVITARLRRLCRQLLPEEPAGFPADSPTDEPAAPPARPPAAAVSALREFLGRTGFPPARRLAQLPPETLAKTLAAHGPQFTAELLALAGQPADSAGPDAETQARLRQLCLQLLPAEQDTPDDGRPDRPLVRDQAAGTLVEKAFEQAIPDKLRQAIGKYALPELKEALVWLKLVEGRDFSHLEASTLRQASRRLRELAAAVERHARPAAQQTPGQSSLTFMLPLYPDGGKRAYPAYIHICQDKEQSGRQTPAKASNTWLRLCLLTENIGMVDLMLHLYGQNSLSIRIAFGDNDTAGKFQTFLPAIAGRFADSPFTLADISVGAAPAGSDAGP